MSWETNAVFEESAEFDCRMSRAVRVPEDDHARLLNRDAPDQHPMGAVTGLEAALDVKLSASQALSNLEIETILGG